MSRLVWSAGVDLGGTKIQLIQVNAFGTIGEKIKIPTDVSGGPNAVEEQIIETIKTMEKKIGSPPSAIGVGVAGQIDAKTGDVIFAPNLNWRNAPFQTQLKRSLGIPVVVTNDVRAATWGEWLHGSGKGATNLLCIFVGTGIGGGIISEGKMVAGKNNTAGEIGHMTIAVDGPQCTCGNFGCIEAFSGGWAIAKRAKEKAKKMPNKATKLLEIVEGNAENIQGKDVIEAAKNQDPIAKEVIEEAAEALAAGASSLINTLSPERVVFGGGIIEGMPDLIKILKKRITQRSLKAALKDVDICLAKLKNEAGAIGAGAFATRLFIK